MRIILSTAVQPIFLLLTALFKYAWSGATMPRPFECYSCMSSSYQTTWNFLQQMYLSPKTFSDACDEPISRRSQIPTVLCASFCVSMLEANVEAGIFVGFKYIRGCGDRMLRHGFNQTAVQIHRLSQVDKCRHLPRERLFNQPRQLGIVITGDLQLCTCYGERCNNDSPSSATRNVDVWHWYFWLITLLMMCCQIRYSQLFLRNFR